VGENEDVLVTVDRGFGLIRLNRPRAINSLTPTMVSAISQALTEWEHDDDISAVVLSGEGERGLCAGGDIVDVVYKSALGDHTLWITFHAPPADGVEITYTVQNPGTFVKGLALVE